MKLHTKPAPAQALMPVLPLLHLRAGVLSHYPEVASQLGVNTRQLLSRVGLTETMLANPEQPIPIHAPTALLEATANACDGRAVGLLMAEARKLADFGPVSLLLSHQRTVRDAIHTTQQYRHLLNQSLAVHVEDAGRYTLVREEVLVDGNAPARQANELAVGVMCFMFRAMLGPQWRPQSVHFVHGEPDDVQVHKRVFQCKLVFDSDFNGMACQTSDLEKPLEVADPVMARYAQTFIDALPDNASVSVVLDIRKSIYLLLPMGRANIKQIAQSMNMNVRTLQRVLGESDSTFTELINGVRSELAQRYIANPHYALTRIAQLLGYANATAFTRWFRAQFGVSPSEQRRQYLVKSKP
jgi:AraC-like DNA-binding protein